MTLSNDDSFRATAYPSSMPRHDSMPSHASAGGSKSPSKAYDHALLDRDLFAESALGSLGRYAKNFERPARDHASSHKQRILDAAALADDRNDFSGIDHCWKNNNTASLRSIVTNLTAVTKLSIDGAGMIPPLTDADAARLGELAAKPNERLTRDERSDLIRLSAHSLLKKKVFVVEFSQLGSEQGINTLKNLFDARQAHADRDSSLTAELTKVFDDVDKINTNKAILDSKRREPVRSTLKAVRRIFGSSNTSPAAPNPLPASPAASPGLKAKVRTFFVGSEEYGYNGFGKKAESSHRIQKSYRAPNTQGQEPKEIRHGTKMLAHAVEGGVRGYASELFRQFRRQNARSGPPADEWVSRGYRARSANSTGSGGLRGASIVGESRSLSEGGEVERSTSLRPPPVPPKDKPAPKAARMPTARVASSDWSAHPDLEVDHETIEHMRLALKYLETPAPEPVHVTILQPTVRVPDIDDMFDPANRAMLEVALQLSGSKAGTEEVAETYQTVVMTRDAMQAIGNETPSASQQRQTSPTDQPVNKVKPDAIVADARTAVRESSAQSASTPDQPISELFDEAFRRAEIRRGTMPMTFPDQ